MDKRSSVRIIPLISVFINIIIHSTLKQAPVPGIEEEIVLCENERSSLFCEYLNRSVCINDLSIAHNCSNKKNSEAFKFKNEFEKYAYSNDLPNEVAYL